MSTIAILYDPDGRSYEVTLTVSHRDGNLIAEKIARREPRVFALAIGGHDHPVMVRSVDGGETCALDLVPAPPPPRMP